MEQVTIDELIQRFKSGDRKASPKRGMLALSPQDIKKAKEAIKLGATQAETAKALNVSHFTLWCALHGQKAYAEGRKEKS